MKYSTSFALALAASIAPSALSHGFLASIAIDGKVFQGNVPNQGNSPSPIRVIDDITPVKGANNRDVNCGKNAVIASMVAPAHPGSVVSFDWHSGENTIVCSSFFYHVCAKAHADFFHQWPHNIGPMMTYMAVCGNTTCDQFDAINAQWFKIDQAGQLPNNLSVWQQQALCESAWLDLIRMSLTCYISVEGQSVNVTLPQNIAPGDYLLRHEIVALHLGNEPGGAEFYPSCSQIRISSNNGTVVEPNATVSLPGAYSDKDPGIFVPTVSCLSIINLRSVFHYHFSPQIFDPVQNYQFPGPSISNVVTGVNSMSSANTTSAIPASSAPKATTMPKASCAVRPRQISRVMRNFRYATKF